MLLLYVFGQPFTNQSILDVSATICHNTFSSSVHGTRISAAPRVPSRPNSTLLLFHLKDFHLNEMTQWGQKGQTLAIHVAGTVDGLWHPHCHSAGAVRRRNGDALSRGLHGSPRPTPNPLSRDGEGFGMDPPLICLPRFQALYLNPMAGFFCWNPKVLLCYNHFIISRVSGFPVFIFISWTSIASIRQSNFSIQGRSQ